VILVNNFSLKKVAKGIAASVLEDGEKRKINKNVKNLEN